VKVAATIPLRKAGTAQRADGRIVELRRVTGYRLTTPKNLGKHAMSRAAVEAEPE
jgi:hypothetical protein